MDDIFLLQTIAHLFFKPSLPIHLIIQLMGIVYQMGNIQPPLNVNASVQRVQIVTVHNVHRSTRHSLYNLVTKFPLGKQIFD